MSDDNISRDERVARWEASLSEADTEKLAAFRAAIREGEESGPATPFDFKAFLDERFPKK